MVITNVDQQQMKNTNMTYNMIVIKDHKRHKIDTI